MINLHNKLFNTNPFLIHLNGSHLKNSKGRKFRSEVFNFMDKNVYGGNGGIRDTTYFTCSTYESKETNLEKSLKFFKVPYVLKGRGIKNWENPMKAGLLAEYLPQINTKYTMGIDSHDVFLIRDANQLIDTFEKDFDCDMVFNGELTSYPLNKELENFEKEKYKSSPFHYLNSGVWIAKTDFLKSVINDILTLKSSRPKSDQEIYRKLHKKYYPSIQIDYQCRLFQTTCESCFDVNNPERKETAYKIEIDKTEDFNYNLDLIKC